MTEPEKKEKEERAEKKPLKKVFREWSESFIVALVIVIAIKYLFFEIYKIPTSSMEPTLIGMLKGGDRVIVNKLKYRFMEPKRWDVFVFHDPDGTSKNLIKRITGMPGEKIVVINGDIFVKDKSVPEEKPPVVQKQVYLQQEDLRFDDEAWELRFAPEKLRAQIITREKTGGKLFIESPGKGKLRYTRPITNFYLRKGSGWLKCTHGMGEMYRHVPEASTLDSYVECPECGRKVDLLRVGRHALKQESSLGIEPPYPIRSGGSAVGDMKVSFELICSSITGYAGCIILENDMEYIFLISPVGSANKSMLIIKDYQTKEMLASDVIDFRLYKGFRGTVAFENVDNRESLYIEGERVYSRVFDWSRFPDREPLKRSGLKLIFDGFRGSIDNFTLLRDIYYTNRYDPGGVGSHAVDPEFPFELGEGEFFAMGDNSSNSKDSRYFGPVHRDFVMGNAVMVMPWFFNTRCKLVK